MKLMINGGKLAVIFFWIIVVLNLFDPLVSPFYRMFILFGALSLAAHIVEIFVYRSLIMQSHQHFLTVVNILVFGGFHIMAIKSVAAAPADPSTHFAE